MALNYPDPSASPWKDPNDVWWEWNGIGWRKQSVSSINHNETTNRSDPDSHPPGAISALSLPNLLFNSSFLITDHGGGNRTPGINVYGFNRWRGSAIGLKQTVEGASITSGNYTLSWAGGGTGSLNGVEGTSPITGALVEDTDADAEVPSDAVWAKLEQGDNVTPYQRPDIGEDISKCNRYYYKYSDTNIGSLYGLLGNNRSWVSSVFPTMMRSIVNGSVVTDPSYSGCTNVRLSGFSDTAMAIIVDVSATGTYSARNGIYEWDAEIYD